MNAKSFLPVAGLLTIAVLMQTGMYAQSPRTVPADYPTGIPVNYIRTWDAAAPEPNEAALVTRPVKDVKQATQYFDGLGRPLQTVMKEGSLETSSQAKGDMVSAAEYDAFGREQFKYLPFVSTATDGLFKMNPFAQQATFMTSQYGTQSETFFYNQTNFEASPLNRTDKAMAPGNSWVGSSRGVEMKYWINTVIDDVKKWNVADVANSFGTYSINGAYPAGELYKNVTVDEHGKQVVEFKDKEGKVILKKVQLTAAADNGNGINYTGWLCTYYIYDDLNNLRCVIQPEAVKTLAIAGFANCTPLGDGGILGEQCFRYEYDARNRMIKKKVPGAGEVWMVYDARDRLVMTQDANMRSVSQQKWMYTTYDELNRPVSAGLITDPVNYNNHTAHLNAAYNSTAYPNVAAYTGEELTKTFYDDYSWLGSYSNPLPAAYNASYNNHFQPVNNLFPYPQTNTQSFQLKGMATGSRIKVLGSSTYLYTVSFYDTKGRVIQVQSTNITGGTDIATTQYTWAGQPLVMVQRQEKQGSGAQTSVVVSQMTYDDLGRVVKTEKKVSNTLVNGNAMSSYKTIAQNEYDKPGQLKKKLLGTNATATGALETENFDYNIRGWMLGMNRDYARDANSTNWFGFDLGYDKANNNIIGGQTYNNPQYNGNIEGTVWKSKGDGEKRKYDFSYDAANRILSADFNQYTGGSFNKTANIDFSMSGMSYDANGNILAMSQKGWKITGSTFIDQLTYNYMPNSNKLLNVIDASNDAGTKLGDFRTSLLHPTQSKTITTVDYTYDANGNLKKDLNKDIGTAAVEDIVYNYLNLPQSITVRTTNGAVKGTIAYTYDAAGNKLQKTVTETGQTTKITLYLTGVIYENDILQFIGHEEGRMRPGTTGFSYDYFIKDHLGNVRVVLTEEQQTDMYPAATLEPATITNESIYYGNLTNTQLNKPSFFTDPLYPNSGNTKVARVKNTGTTQKVGPNMILKVMAGDSYNIRVASGWSSASAATNSNTNVITDLLSLLSSSAAGASGGKATAAELQSAGSGLNSALTSFANSQTTSGTKPKAYINWILLDEQFKVVTGSSGFEQVGASGATTIHVKNNIAINKSGYLYVYTSNDATNIDVYFDNLQVTHIRGSLTQEQSFYPFGLEIRGLSSSALAFGSPGNQRLKFNGIEQNNDFDLNMYDAHYRNLDPQIGRFWQLDPKPNETFSSYAAMANNPILYSDPLGDTTWVYGNTGRFLGVVNDNLANQTHFLNREGGATPFDASKLSLEDAINMGQGFRDESTAFMGSNTLSDMKNITAAAVKDNQEVLFTGMVGKDKEIRLTAVKTEKGEYAKIGDVDKILDKNFTKEQQANLFLVGHVHQQNASSNGLFKTIISNPLQHFGRPSSPDGTGSSGDYGPYLYRSATATQRGQSPALILSRYGFTIYGTASSPPTYMPEVSAYSIPGRVIPSTESYFLYKQLKK